MILQFQTDCYHNIQLLKDDKEQAVKDKEEAEKRAEKAEKDLHSLEERRERLQPVMDNVSKEIKEYGTVKTLLPEAGALERATTYRDKKIKPLFTQVIIPGLFEPPVRTLRATIPENESHIFR